LSTINFESQANEIHASMKLLNNFTKLGRSHTQVMP
ncbi:IS5/IS1182 family transposase, partial [Acinetobacter sp. I-MWF]|nr:IS5/IS1182 family transposase [Acinetobacter sp. I-MWF]